MKKTIQFVYDACYKVCFFLVGIILVYMFMNSIFSTSLMRYQDEHTYFIKDFPLLMVVGLFFLIGILFLFKKHISKLFKNSLRWMCGITVFWLSLMLFWVISADVEMVYDQKSVYDGIRMFLQGDYSEWQKGGYFYMYPLQNGLLFMFMPIMKICGEYTYEAVQVLNILSIWLIAFGCYKLAKKYFSASVAFFSYIGVLMFVPLWGYVKFFYGNLMGLSLIVFSVYWLACFLEEPKQRYLVGSILCELFAVIFKSNFSIFVIAMVIVLILQGLKNKKLRYGFAGFLLIMVMFIGMKGPAILAGMITGCTTDQGVPTIKWIELGLTESNTAPGWYSGDTFSWYAQNGYSVSRAKESAYESIEKAMAVYDSDKWYGCRFFTRKFSSIWNNPTFETFAIVIKGNTEGNLPYWIKDTIHNGGIINTLLTIVLDVVQSIYLFGMVLYMVFCKKEKELERAIPLIALIGGVLFHMFWEGKCQYTIIYIPLLFPYAFNGYKRCVNLLGEWFAREQDEKFNLQKVFARVGKTKGMKSFLAIFILVAIVELWDNQLFTSTVKLQADTSEYIEVCRVSIDWKEDSYVKE